MFAKEQLNPSARSQDHHPSTVPSTKLALSSASLPHLLLEPTMQTSKEPRGAQLQTWGSLTAACQRELRADGVRHIDKHTQTGPMSLPA